MSIIEKIVQQDSLLENSQIQYFIEPQIKVNKAKCSTALYPAQVIPSVYQRAFSFRKQQSSRNLLTRGNSASSFSQRQFLGTKFSFKNLVASSQHTRQFTLRDSMVKAQQQMKRKAEKSINVQKINQQIDFRRVLELKERKSFPLGLTRKLSGNALGAKSKVDNLRKLIQKKLAKSPFNPAFLQSQYLE